MITTVNVHKQDIEEMIDKALSEYQGQHNKTPRYLILGRLAYEELRTLQNLGQRETIDLQSYNDLDLVVVEEPNNALAIGCKPD